MQIHKAYNSTAIRAGMKENRADLDYDIFIQKMK